MRRAAVVIGVDRTGGGLARLESAAAGAREFATLLEAEGFDVQCLADDRKDPQTGDPLPVTNKDVREAIKSFVTLPARYHLLVVYFSGHGYWQARSDVWLLSGAPQDPAEAINLSSAEDLAKYSGIPNVVFISDACRSLPNARSGALVEAAPVFPNYAEVTGISKMDFFKATTESLPAFEIPIAGRKQSVLTAALLSAFKSPNRDMVRELHQGTGKIYVVPNRRLEGYLPGKVNDLLRAHDPSLSQELEIDVPSSDDIYIARVQNPPPVAPASPQPVPPPPAAAAPSPPAPVPPMSAAPKFNARELIARSLSNRAFAGMSPSGSMLGAAEGRTRTAAEVRLPSAQVDHFETQMGVVVKGLPLESAHAVTAVPGATAPDSRIAELVTSGEGAGQPGIVRLHSNVPLSVLLRVKGGRCAVLAGLPGYIAHASFDKRGLSNVSYVPSSNHWRWHDYQSLRDELDELRALVAIAADEGKFRLRSNREANELAGRLRVGKSVDPTLGLYAAQAFYQAGNESMVRDVLSYMRADLHADLYDVRLLAHRQFSSDPSLPVVPFCPMLAQSWNLLRSREAPLPAAMHKAGRYLADSLWSTYEPAAANLLFEAFFIQGEEVASTHDSRSGTGWQTMEGN